VQPCRCLSVVSLAGWLVCSERWLGGGFAIARDRVKLTVLLARLMEGAAGSSVVVGILASVGRYFAPNGVDAV
jgi:hypothetical protein